jgi:anaerobic selenocysteine-containing dehydrogenase
MQFLRRVGPARMLALFLRLGPHRISLAELAKQEHTSDLGPLEPCLPKRLSLPRKRIDLAPSVYVGDFGRLLRRHPMFAPADDSLVLIGRRQLRSNNSWMHRFTVLASNTNRCTLRIHPGDADSRGIGEGDEVEIRSRAGAVVAPAELTDRMMPGVVSLPHGFGHGPERGSEDEPPTHWGVSLNDLTDDVRIDELTGAASFSGVPVIVRRRLMPNHPEAWNGENAKPHSVST